MTELEQIGLDWANGKYSLFEALGAAHQLGYDTGHTAGVDAGYKLGESLNG